MTSNLDLPVDVGVAMRFCEELVQGDQGAIITFQIFDDRKNGSDEGASLVRVFHCTLKQLEHALTSHVNPLAQKGAGVYVMVNQGDGRGRSAKNVTSVRAVFVDLDEDGYHALEKIKDCPDIPRPHLIVETSPDKYHVYWLVEGMELGDFKAVQVDLSKRCGGDPVVKDLCRVLRLPGSWHQKNEPHIVKIAYKSPAPLYPAVLFTDLLSQEQDVVPSGDSGISSTSDFEQWMTSQRHAAVSTEQVAEMLVFVDQVDDYERWIKVGMALHHWGGEGLPLWLKWSSQAANYDEEECRAKWASFSGHSGVKVTIGTLFHFAKIGGWHPPMAGDDHLTDAGNAQRLVKKFGANIRFCPEYKSWFFWTGQRWAPDSEGAVMQFAIKAARLELEEANTIEDDDRRTRHIRWAMNSESKLRLEAAIVIAKSLPGVSIHPDQMDQDPYLLNVENGTLDLKTGGLRPHRKDDYITRLVKIAYSQNKKECLRWLQFLEEIMEGDIALLDYVQRVVGYCLTSDISEQCLFFLHGHGANGKSTFINVLSHMLGDYATQTSCETFMIKQNTGGATPELAILAGKRVVTANETEEGKPLAEATIKQLCGGDQITARPLYGAPFTFSPTFKIVIAGNYKPQIRGGDHGIWRRIHLVPFTVTIPPEQQDKKLHDRLKDELPEILQWAVEGCMKWQQEGLTPPSRVVTAVEEYRSHMDTIGQWLDECCRFAPGLVTPSGTLYSSYRAWALTSGHGPMSQKRLGETLRMRGLQNAKISGVRSWHGVAVDMFKSVVPQFIVAG
jgi:putative DNA primase/helicase